MTKANRTAFKNELDRDEDGRLVVKSMCNNCGDSKLVSVRDGSLARWESYHTCPGVPKMPPRFAD
jgi:hypothetical protein